VKGGMGAGNSRAKREKEGEDENDIGGLQGKGP